jgi:endo-1,4-beta-xylanase
MKPTLCLLALALGCPWARAAILRAITDELPAAAPASINPTTQTVRGGPAAFRHVARAGGDAAEFAIPAAGAGDERWYGWSTQLPADFAHRGRSTQVMQLVEVAPAKPDPTQCPVSTSSLEINGKGQLVFHLHAPAETGAEPKCRAFTLVPDVAPTRGRWFDFVLHAKWTSGPDGFVELWVKQHDNNFFQMVDYRGPTCVSRDRAPEFRIGAQVTARDELPAGDDVAVLTDELRVGDAGSSFDEVAPAGAAARAAEAQRGQIRYVLYPSALNRRKIAVMVYTPPGYATATKRYPVVYNLHGSGGGSPERQWARVRATLTKAMDSGTVPPTIYVFVNALGDTGYIDFPDGRGPKVFSSIVAELIPFIDANYRTIADRRGRGVDGFSMGGSGSLILALKRPDLFSAVVAYGSNFIPHNPNDTNDLRRKLSAEFSQYALVERRTDEIRAHVRIRLVCGDQDQHHAENLKFKAILEGLQIPVSWVSVPGVGHDTTGLFSRVGVESLAFMHEAFETDR